MKMQRLAILLLAIGTIQASEVEPETESAGICATDAVYHAFDFWLGEWEIYSPDGRFGGTNRIVKEEGGCLVTEHWTGPRGGTGQSMNFYDPVERRWRQVWVSDGFTIDYAGGPDESGAMALEGHITYLKAEERFPFRGTWTPLPDDRVRQHLEQQDPETGEWRTWFLADYRPVTEEAQEQTMTHPGHIHHAIDYIEFPVTDIAASKAFYGQAFGWTFNDYGPDYAGIRSAHGEMGGLRRTAEVARGGPLVILYSAELEATLERVREAGGTIVREPYGFPGGRRFHLLDPSGNELAVWSEAS